MGEFDEFRTEQPTGKGEFDEFKPGAAPQAPKPGIPTPASTIGGRISQGVQKVKEWAGAETPESTGNWDWASRVVPTSIAKNVVGMGLAAGDISKEVMKDPLAGPGRAIIKAVPGLLRGTAVSMGLRPPEEETPSGPVRDYGTGLPSSVEQLGARLKHQVRTNPVGVIGSVAGAKAGLKAVPKIAKGAVGRIAETGLPERMQASALKIPYGKAWTKTIGEEGMSKRNAAIEASLKGNVPPTELGIAKSKAMEAAHKDTVGSIIQQLDETGTLMPKEILRPGLKEAYKTAKVEGTDAAEKFVDNLYDKRFEKMGTVNAEGVRVYKPSEIQEIKQHLYKQENYEKTSLARNIGSQLKELGSKGMAKQARLALEELNPDLKLAAANKDWASSIYLTEALERSVPRMQNANLIPLGAKILLGSHVGMALLDLIAGAPRVKSAVARALYRARKGVEPTRHQANQLVSDVKLTAEDYDPSLRAPSGPVSDVRPMQVEGNITPGAEIPATGELDLSPSGLRERALTPEFTRAAGPENIGELPPAEAPPAELQNLGGGIPKAPEVIPQPGRGANLIENKLSQGKGGAVYQSGYGEVNPKFGNTPPTPKTITAPEFSKFMDTEKGGGAGKQFKNAHGEPYEVLDVQGGPDPSIRVGKVGEKGGERVPASQWNDWYNEKSVKPAQVGEVFKAEPGSPAAPTYPDVVDVGNGRTIATTPTYQGKSIARAMVGDEHSLVMRDAAGKDVGHIWYTREPDGGFTVRRIASEGKGAAEGLYAEAFKREGQYKGSTDRTPQGARFIKKMLGEHPEWFRAGPAD